MSNAAQFDDPLGDNLRADLIAFSLGQLEPDEAESLRQRIAEEPDLAAEFDAIHQHLDLHRHAPEISPSPAVFTRLREQIAAEEAPPAPARPPARRSIFKRYWMSMAAAALIIAAMIFPGLAPSRGQPIPTIEQVAGAPTETLPDGTVRAPGLTRIAYGPGVVITMDGNSVIRPLASQRLALEAGRLFLEVEPARRGFTIEVAGEAGGEAGGTRIVTTGTRFLVEKGRVAVEEGTVRVTREQTRHTVVKAGQELRWPGGSPTRLASTAPIAWFRIPTLKARILNPTTISVVLQNEMIDAMQLAPPTGGEPLFFATVTGPDGETRHYPHQPEDFAYNVVLQPGQPFEFEMRISELEDDDAVRLSCKSLGLEVEASR
ncbi:MAG: hypothetical protein AAGD14_14510 [Planctomycetota bacterium]